MLADLPYRPTPTVTHSQITLVQSLSISNGDASRELETIQSLITQAKYEGMRAETESQILDLKELSASDEYDIPHDRTIKYAVAWLNSHYASVTNSGLAWLSPFVNISEESEVVFEWKNRHKHFTIYISETASIYIKSWGPDTETQMEDGNAEAIDTVKQFWLWLLR